MRIVLMVLFVLFAVTGCKNVVKEEVPAEEPTLAITNLETTTPEQPTAAEPEKGDDDSAKK